MDSETKLAPFEKCCRTCLKEDSLMFDLFIERLESSNIADMLVSCTKLKIQKDDSLPKQICRYCYNCLISFSHFCNMAQKSEEKLKEAMVNTDGSLQINSEGYIFEIKIENNDHDNVFGCSEEVYDNHENLDEVPVKINDRHPDLNVKIESSNGDFSCIICSFRFESMNLLSAHMKRHEEKEWVISEQCNRIFRNTPTENENTDKCEQNLEQFQCSICLLMFKTINSRSAHMRKHTEKGRVLSCNVCNKIFKKLSHLKRHEGQHEINCPYKCTLCPKSFTTEDALTDHINQHRGVKPHGCPVCGKKFSHLSTLTAHIKIHTRDKSFLCPTCGKKFDSSTNLNQHISRHVGLKEFACKLCPKRFVSKGELESHTVTHTGERLYTCDQCGATFTKRSSLTKHKTRHLGLKPYQCDTCSMRFTCKDHLKRHYRIHTGEKPYKCDMCDRAFVQSNDLVKHRRSHVGDKVYKCSQCAESFRFNVELRQHISQHFISSQNLQAGNVAETPPTDGVNDEVMSVHKIVNTSNELLIVK